MGAKAGRHEADVLGRSSYEKGRAFFCVYSQLKALVGPNCCVRIFACFLSRLRHTISEIYVARYFGDEASISSMAATGRERLIGSKQFTRWPDQSPFAPNISRSQ